MNLNDFRQKIPQLNGLDDQAALDLLHKHYYPDVDKQRMADVLGVKTPPPPVPERSMARAAGDLGLQFAGGAVSGVRMMSDLFGADNAVSGGLRGAEDALRELQSAAAKGDQQEISRILKEAEGKGVLDQVIAGAKAFGQAPGALIANALGTSVPTLATALIPGVGQGAMAARLAAGAGIGAAQGAGNTKSAIYEEVKNNPLPGETPEQTEFRAVRAQEYGGQNTGQIALGGVLGAAAGSTGMERALSGLRNGVTQAAPGMVARVGMGAAAEAVPEIAQGGQEKLAGNLALRNEGFDVDPMAGVVAGATMEGLAGGLTGGVTAIPRPAVIGEREPVPVPVPPVEPPGPMTKAVNALGPRLTTTPTTDLLGRNTDPLAGQMAADRLAAEDASVTRQNFADRNGAMLAGGGLEGSRVDPLANMLADARTSEANSFTNVQQAANRRPPMPASDAARILDEAKNRGMDLTAAPHPDGGFVVVPRQWVTPDVAAQAETEIADTLARMQQADAAPVERAERRRSEPVDLNLNTDPVAGYIEDLRNTNTPAARAYVGEFDAGRVTRADVEQRMQADRGLTADERLARAAAEGLKLNPKGDPFKTLMAANLAAKTTPGTVIEVPGGYAIRPQESTLANTAAQEVPEADAAPVQAAQSAAAVSFADAADEAGGADVSGGDEQGAVQALSNVQDAPQAANDTAAQAQAVEAPAPARGDGAAAAGVPDAGDTAGMENDGVKSREVMPAGLTLEVGGQFYPVDSLAQASEMVSKAKQKFTEAKANGKASGFVEDAPIRDGAGRIVGYVGRGGSVFDRPDAGPRAKKLYDAGAEMAKQDAGAGAGVRADGVKRSMGRYGDAMTITQADAKVKELEKEARDLRKQAAAAQTKFMETTARDGATRAATLARKLRDDIKDAVGAYPDARAEFEALKPGATDVQADGVKPAGQRQLSADEQAAQDREAARAKEPSLPPVLSARLQEAHKAHGRDVKRSVVERSIANEKADNTGTPKARRERANRIARLEADLALFDEAADLSKNPQELNTSAEPAQKTAESEQVSDPPPAESKPDPETAVAAEQKPAPPKATELTPKQFHDAKLAYIAADTGADMAEVREMYDTEGGRADHQREWLRDVEAAAKAGETLTRQTLDKLYELAPTARLPETATPSGYQRPEARRAEAEEAQARIDNRKAAKESVKAEAAQEFTASDAQAAERQLAQMIGDRIDAMQAQAVQKIGAKFLPTMGIKAPIGKAKIKAAVTDFTRVNPLAAASEFGVEMADSIRLPLERQQEGRLVDATKPAAPAQQEAGSTKKIPPFPVDGYRLERYYANGAKVRPLPAKTFSPADVMAISGWFKSIGWSVTSGSGANGVNATNDVGMTVDDLPEPYTAAQRKNDEAQKAADERAADKQKAQDDYLASTDAGKFVSDMFGDAMNRFNLTALAKVLAGDEKTFGGLFSNRAADVLTDAGIATEGRSVKDVVADIKAKFDAAQQEATQATDDRASTVKESLTTGNPAADMTRADMVQKGRDDFDAGVERQAGVKAAGYRFDEWLQGWNEAKADAEAKAAGKVAVPSDFPLQEVSGSYSGISHSGGSRARSDRDAFVERVQSLYDEAKELAKTDAQQTALDRAIQTYKDEYIAQTLSLARVRSGTYSAFVAGRAKINTRQADSRNSALDKAIDRFSAWDKEAAPKVKAAVLAARTADEVAAEQADRDAAQAAKQEKRQKSDMDLMRKILAAKGGDQMEIGGMVVTKVNNDKEGYPLTLTIKAKDGAALTSDKLNLATEVFGRRGVDGLRQGKEKIRALVDAIRAEGTTTAAEPKAEAAQTASKTPTVDRHEALMKSVREGKTTAEQFKAAFESLVANKDAVLAELETKTKAELLKAGGYFIQMRYASEKKGEVIDAIYRQMVGNFVLGETLSYGMGKGAFEAAVRRHVEATDAAKLEQYAKDRQAAIAEAQAERAAKAAAMDSPQTLADFKTIIAKHIGEGKSAKEAFLSLTPEQRIQFDTLAAESTREAREASKRERKTEVRAAGQTTGGEIIATKHTRDNYDLFVVKLADRLSREDYTTVLASAKKLGGWYSAFRGNGAIPGFQFKDKANAEAFLKLAGGDTADAQTQAEQRRDEFEDDRSETAVERLRTMADKLTEQAAEIESADRKTNTARRARFAASALNGAAEMKAKASTMRNIAQAIEAGGAKFLDAVRTKSQVDLLTGIVATAKNNELRAKYPSYADQEKRKGEPATAETADFAEFPAFTAYRSDLATLGRQLLEVDGTKKLGQRLMSVADDVSDAYLEFAKQPGNLFKLSTFSVKRGDEVKAAIFPNREQAERAIARSGLTGKAIVLAEKRGVNRIIMSPSEAINAGIWTGDGDKRITLSTEFGNELVEAIGRRGNKSNKLTVPWQFQNAYDRRKALSRMGIETPSEYRSALREFIGLQERAIANKVKEMELAMVGRKADGLDFFPTPAEVADQMIEAADITPDMAVLEPSAGMGHIADRIREAGAEPDVIEISPERRELLQEKGYHLAETDDFMAMEPRKFFTYGDVFRAPDGTEGVMQGSGGMGSRRVVLKPLIDGVEVDYKRGQWYDRDELVGVRHRGSWSGYDRIIMNPPFSNRRDAEHVMHAYTLLKPGGRIVAIMGEGVFFGQDKKAQEFRDWLESVNGTSEKLPAGSFMDPSLPVNTGVSARMVVIDKPAGDVKFSIDDDTAKPQTQTAAFKRWFGDSKVVDADGKPLVVYHGSPDLRFLNEDGVFKSQKGRIGFGQADAAHWFTPSKATAKTYADPRRAFDYQNAEEGVVAAYIKLEKPLVIDGGGQNWRDAQKRGKTSDVIEEARKGGHDGVIIRNVKDDYNNGKGTRPTDTYVVFESTQIKSATGNRGTFDPDNADIRASIDDDTATADTADYGPATQAHRDAAARFSEAFGNRLAGSGPDADLLDAVAPGEDTQRGRAAASVAAVAQHLFNREVVFVKFRGEPKFNGAVSKAAPGFIFLNIDSQKPLMAVLGHELLHEMAKSQPAMYANLSRRLDGLIKNETEYGIRLVNQYKKQGISTKGLDAREELEADIVGDNFMDAEFWQAMGENQPGLFKRIVGYITRWLDGLTQKLTGYRAFGTDEFLADIAAARDAVASAMREFSGAEAGAVTDPVDGDVKLSAAEKQDQTQTAAFRAWFAGSKVVDSKGSPMVVYHGSPSPDAIGEFQPKNGGIYFSNDRKTAEEYTAQRGMWRGRKTGAVTEAFVALKNPLVIDAAGKRNDNIPVPWQQWKPKAFGNLPAGALSVQAVAEYAEENGYDGLIVRNVIDTADIKDTRKSDVFVAFNSSQVKSATGNRGTFDPDNADIRFSVADDIKKAIPAFDVKTAPKNSWAHYRGMAMQALGRRQIVDLYAEELPQLAQYDYLVQQMDAEKNDSGAEADRLAQDWGKLKDEKPLAELMHDATLAQIDPAKPMVAGVLQAQYRELKARFDALTPEAQDLYRQARDMYEGHYRKVQKAIKERIERSEMSAGQKRQIMARMDEEMFKQLKGVYFPLARFGQYVIVVKDANGEVKNVTRAETVGEAEEARKELHKAFPKHMGYTVGKVLKQAEFNAGRDAVGKGFMADLMDALDSKGIDDELRDTVAQLYLSSLPDLSWAKHGIHRKGTPGFSQDARRAFAQNMFHGARYLAKLRYADQLQDELIAMQDHVKAYEGVEEYDSIQAQQVVDEMVKRHEIMMNPKTSGVSTWMTSMGFVFHLGLSPASAMVNLSQTALVAYPMMGAKWGWGKASAALLAASQDVVKAKNDLGTILKGAELDAYERAVKDGTIDVTMAHDLAGISQGEDQKVFWKIRPVMRAASFMFHHAERFNRQATFIAAWRMAKEAGPDKTADQLYEEAKKLTYDSHFDYSASNRPRVMQGNWQRVIFLFKQYAQAMVYTLSRNAYLSIKGLTPADRALARKNLGGILATHAAAAGVLGLPLVGPLLTAASFIGSDDDEPWDAEVAMQNVMADMVGPKAAEVMARGFSRLTPFDLSGRVALNKLILPDVQEGLEGKQWAESAMAAALGPVAGIGVNMARGFQKITEGHYMTGLEDMMPTALRAPLRAMRYASEGAVDKTGVVITDEVGPGSIAGQALGFSPSEVRRATERKAAIMDYDRSLADRRSSLVRQWAEAQMAGDTDGVKDVMGEIQGFNQKNPNRKITMPHLIQSVRARRRRIEQAEDGVYLPKNREGAREAVRF